MSSSRTDVLIDVTMPQMGVSVAEGTVVAWRAEVGERIEADETICEISTDKIDTEVPAPVSGVVAEILVEVDQTVAVGTVLARIGGASSSASSSSSSAADAVSSSAAPATSAPSDDLPEAGASNGAGVGGLVESNGAGAGERQSLPRERQRGRYSPVVQRIAAEHGIDLSTVEGTGRDGRVRKQDVLAVVNAEPAARPATPAAPEPPLHIESPYVPEPAPVAPAGGATAITGGQLSRMRRQIGEHMKRSLQTAAHCTTWIEVDMSRVESVRTRLGLTALAYVSSATIAALREHPALNATIEGDEYAQHHDINLGIAVSLGEDGLIVPVIHRAHELSVEGLGARIKDLARRARGRELTPDDVTGGTFTITNPGQYGSIMATPIINQPQVAILDFEAVIKRPVVVTDAAGNDSIAIRPITILGLSWDHRALDGALAAQFLATLKRLLES